MKSWPSPTVPTPSVQAPPLTLTDPVTGVGSRVTPEGTARLYVCGITPYDATHLGHAATYLMVDTVRRILAAGGHEVVLAQNVTDVDDPLLERAARDGVDWQVLAERETDLFREDMTWLRVVAPEHFAGVVESMDVIVREVEALVARGATYTVPAGDGAAEGVQDVYLDLTATTGFGTVSRLTRAEMLPIFAERGGDPERDGKRDALDPLLWRGERPGEPSYDGGTLGRGRPGWHIECTAIAREHLGDGFDVQAGGTDLLFPHHEMSAVQATAAAGPCAFARHYVHQAMVGLDGEKMSKSRGNLVFVHALRERGADPMAVRAALLDHHHGTEWSWSDAELEHATTRLERWRDAASLGTEASAGWVERFLGHVAADLDTPSALKALDAWAAGGIEIDESGEPPVPCEDVLTAADAVLGLDLRG